MIEPVGYARASAETAFPAAGSRFASIGCRPRRRLARHRLGSRWLAERNSEPGPVVAYLLRLPTPADPSQAAEARLRAAAAFRHAHVLPILALDLTPGEGPALLSPYPGTFEGICTLAQALAASNGGRLDVVQCRAAAEQILGALGEVQRVGLPHGPIRIDEVLIDGRGRTMLELVGVEAAMNPAPAEPRERLRAETRSVAAIVYELITGVTVARPCLPASKLVQRLPRAWSCWLDAGLDPGAGFADAREAIAALPDF